MGVTRSITLSCRGLRYKRRNGDSRQAAVLPQRLRHNRRTVRPTSHNTSRRLLHQRRTQDMQSVQSVRSHTSSMARRSARRPVPATVARTRSWILMSLTSLPSLLQHPPTSRHGRASTSASRLLLHQATLQWMLPTALCVSSRSHFTT